MLTHEPYFDALQVVNNTTAEWRSILAGLLVLRLVDSWLEHDMSLVVKDVTNVQAVQEALSGVQERDSRLSRLSDLVEIVTQSEQPGVPNIAISMLEYGRTLYENNQWTLALDVFASLLSHALADQDETTILSAAGRLAFVLKQLGQLEAADSAYALVFQRTSGLDRPEFYFPARIGFSDNLVRRGRFTEAESVLGAVVMQTSALGLTDLHASALHQMASIAMERQDYGTAIRLGQTALTQMSQPRRRTHILMHLGGAHSGAGNHETAKHILLSQLQQTQEENVRQGALITLLEITAKDGDQPMFNRYRQQLDGTLVLPVLQVDYYLYVAKGHHLFRNSAGAREAWQNALEIALAHGLAQMVAKIHLEMAAAGEKPNSYRL
jgi:tetratricopeptide (TPR) repeat protein